MSSPTWTHVALSTEFQRYDKACWRLVEAQHKVSTLKLTDTLAEQYLLEELIEKTKPVIPPECRHLDFLLATPFRYDAVYPKGSHFRRAGRTPGVFYAAETSSTAVAELAFHRLLFFAESPDTPWPLNPSEYTAFGVEVASDRLLDLSRPPLVSDFHVWTDLTDYTGCQAFADAARTAGAEAIRYLSARDPNKGCNVAILNCAAFAKSAPVDQETWRMRFSAHGVLALCEAPVGALEFPRDTFAADPRIAALNWVRDA
ncbi:RES family NAD+ phosphorylase [Hyphomicrobium sulfonivorans]|uniref:RES family NAD+ phosphorylase n=1 Tax=Hyphomicrobium sulfonivorans TaxID=121290 RepID=UPI00156FFF85|nr:RES family NAD+ phosphorylase [Hyphomicrobium sulfonivorans]MBI1648984.1 RES family NAD+ phosphorylase [Hyphomicrobium sulfonivorans]NSL70481.1 hypothetical protein [Hyphomicrobium sulfonivorans]